MHFFFAALSLRNDIYTQHTCNRKSLQHYSTFLWCLGTGSTWLNVKVRKGTWSLVIRKMSAVTWGMGFCSLLTFNPNRSLSLTWAWGMFVTQTKPESDVDVKPLKRRSTVFEHSAGSDFISQKLCGDKSFLDLFIVPWAPQMMFVNLKDTFWMSRKLLFVLHVVKYLVLC